MFVCFYKACHGNMFLSCQCWEGGNRQIDPCGSLGSQPNLLDNSRPVREPVSKPRVDSPWETTPELHLWPSQAHKYTKCILTRMYTLSVPQSHWAWPVGSGLNICSISGVLWLHCSRLGSPQRQELPNSCPPLLILMPFPELVLNNAVGNNS